MKDEELKADDHSFTWSERIEYKLHTKEIKYKYIECIPDGMKEAGKLLSMFVNEEQHLTQGNNSTKLSCFKS